MSHVLLIVNMNKKIEMTKLEDVGNTTPVTYKSYISMYGQPYKHFIMLAELIDNSISSFENEFGEKEWDRNLEIDMKFDFRGDIKETKDNNLGFKYIENSSIIVVDNGFGMRDKMGTHISELLKASLILDNNNTQISDKNVWGRGMKQCAYFFGQDLTVTTSNGEETFEVAQIYTDENISQISPYKIIPYKTENIESGTMVKIENIYDERVFSEAVFRGIVESLEWRYVNYIKKGKLKITCSFIDNDNEIIGKLFEFREEEVRIISDSDKEKISKKGKDLFKSIVENEFLNLEKRSVKNNYNLSLLNDAYNNLLQIFMTSIEGDNSIPIESTVHLIAKHVKTGENISVPFKFWALPNGSKDKNAGIRLYEGDRAITHVSIKDKNVGPWMDWVEQSDKSWRTDKKFAGEIDLKLIAAKPSVDKSMFSIPEETLNSISRDIWTVYLVFNIFLRFLSKQEDVNDIEKFTTLNLESIEQSTLENDYSEKVRLNKEKSNPEEMMVNFEYGNEDDFWEADVTFNYEAEKPAHILYPVVDSNDERKVKIIVYRRHEFWGIIKSASKNDENIFLNDVICPIVHLIINSSIKVTNPKIKVNLKEEKEFIKSQIDKAIRGDDFIG